MVPLRASSNGAVVEFNVIAGRYAFRQPPFSAAKSDRATLLVMENERQNDYYSSWQ
jgi:hypothetical protein